MSRGQRVIAAVLTTVIALGLAYIALSLAGLINLPMQWQRAAGRGQRAEGSGQKVETVSARQAFEVAAAEARKWQADAAPASLMAEKAEESGQAEGWQFVFAAPSAKETGYLVTVKNDGVISREEIPYRGKGAELPAEMLAPEEAVSAARQVKGYENAEILGIEAVYDEGGKTWYWGVKTPRGIISVKAQRP